MPGPATVTPSNGATNKATGVSAARQPSSRSTNDARPNRSGEAAECAGFGSPGGRAYPLRVHADELEENPVPTKSGPAGRVLTTGLMLFALFFGAGNLIFPPALGASAGSRLVPVVLGFLATGVLMPLVGVIAVSTSGEGITGIAGRVGPRFGVLMPLAVNLSIGPLYAVPRVATVSYELATRPVLALLGLPTGRPALAVHVLVFFAVSVLLALRPSRMADRVGGWLTPALLVLIAVLCTVVLIGMPVQGRTAVGEYAARPFATGLTRGYMTMDMLAATVFGIVVMTSLRSKGITTRRSIMRATCWSGIIAALLLAVVYVGLALLGTRAVGDAGDGTALLRSAAASSLGTAGVVVFAAIVLLACLTTSVGLLSAWGQFSNDLWPRVSFTREVLAAALVSLVLANLGLAAILTVVSPLTLLLYPITITLVLVTLVDVVAPGHLRAAYRWGVVCSTALGLVSALSDLGWTAPSRLLARTGLWNDQTGWILPTAVFAVVGLVIDVVAGRWSMPVEQGGRGDPAVHRP